MSVFEAAIGNNSTSTAVLQFIRKSTEVSLAEIRQRIAEGLFVLCWNTDDYPLDGDRQSLHNRILADIQRLRTLGCELRFQYRPTVGDVPETVTYQQILNLMETDIEMDNSDHI